jgi:hypothetical protein
MKNDKRNILVSHYCIIHIESRLHTRHHIIAGRTKFEEEKGNMKSDE